MPITAGIKCAYCDMMIDNDYIMQLHLKTHKDEIKEAEKLRDAERIRIRRNKEVR